MTFVVQKYKALAKLTLPLTNACKSEPKTVNLSCTIFVGFHDAKKGVNQIGGKIHVAVTSLAE